MYSCSSRILFYNVPTKLDMKIYYKFTRKTYLMNIERKIARPFLQDFHNCSSIDVKKICTKIEQKLSKGTRRTIEN